MSRSHSSLFQEAGPSPNPEVPHTWSPGGCFVLNKAEILSCLPVSGKALQKHTQAPAYATVKGEMSRPHACLLLYPLVIWQLGQQPASQTGDRCSGCLSLLPACGVPLRRFLLLQGLIKLKPLHKKTKPLQRTTAQSPCTGLTEKTPTSRSRGEARTFPAHRHLACGHKITRRVVQEPPSNPA